MAFDLIDSRYDAGYFFQLFEIMDPEIADSDRMCSAGTEDFFQFLPGTEIASRNWPVNQVKINVIQAKPIKTSLKSSVYISEPLCVVPDFCGDKKIFSGDAAFCNTPSDPFFVLVCGSGIDQPVSAFYSVDNRIFGFVFFGCLIYTQPQKRHFFIIV